MDLSGLEKNRHEMNISRESIEYITKTIKNNKLKNVLEIGTFNGYSALKLSAAAEHVTTIEIDKVAAEIAKSNFIEYKSGNIKILIGDAKDILRKMNENFDLVLIDAMKKEYREYLVNSLRLVKKGFVYADNTVSHKEYMNDFFEYLNKNKLDWKELGIGKGLVEIRVGVNNGH